MALILKRNLPSGYEADYFRIVAVAVGEQGAVLDLAVYKSMAARRSGKAPVEVAKGFKLSSMADFMQVKNRNVFARAYELLKARPEMEGAKDG